MVRGALFVDLDGVLVPEGGVPREELVDEDSQRPPVHRGGVALVMDDFGREVLRGAAQGVRLDRVARLVVSQALGEAKVDELDVALAVEEQVLGLHVPVGYPPLLLVQVLQDQDNLGGVEAGHVLAEPAELAQVGEELATGHVVEEDVEELVVREGGDEAGDEGMSGHVCQDLALVAHVVELLELDHCDGSALVFLLPKPGGQAYPRSCGGSLAHTPCCGPPLCRGMAGRGKHGQRCLARRSAAGWPSQDGRRNATCS